MSLQGLAPDGWHVSAEDVEDFVSRMRDNPPSADGASTLDQHLPSGAANPAWLATRRGRLTASRFGAAAGHNKFCSPMECLKEMMWGSFQGNDATRYGNFFEDTAEAALGAMLPMQFGSRNLRMEHRGMLLATNYAKYPYVGMSPDGILCEGGDDGTPHREVALIEYKCPYGRRGNGKVYAGVPHYYYDQIQGIMHYRENLPEAHFVVWTPEQVRWTRVPYDPVYGADLAERLADFYYRLYAPAAIRRARGVLPKGEVECVVSLGTLPVLTPAPAVVAGPDNFIGDEDKGKRPRCDNHVARD